jgi:hypothetical protein
MHVRLTKAMADKVICDFDRACCVCRRRTRFPIVHHIDGDRRNNVPRNLAVLCPEHHAEAHMTSGLARRLSPGQIRQFREDWLRRLNRKQELKRAALPRTPAEHEDIIAALACLEVRKLGWMLPGTRWNGTPALLKELGFYANCLQSYTVDEEIMEALDGLMSWSPDGLPWAVANQIEGLVPPSDFVGQVASSGHRVPKRKQQLLKWALDIGRSMVYDAVRYHPDIKVVASGAGILHRPLRYAELNHLREIKREAIEVFREMEALASQYKFDDARRWLVFQRQDALCVGNRRPPQFPSDVADRINGPAPRWIRRLRNVRRHAKSRPSPRRRGDNSTRAQL